MKALTLNNQDLQEISIDMGEFNFAIANHEESYKKEQSFSEIGKILYSSKKKGHVYVTHWSSLFHKDVCIKPDIGIEGILLYFIENSKGTYCYSNNGRENYDLLANSNNIFFSPDVHNIYTDFFSKNAYNNCTSLHLTTDYFKKLVEQYPALFEKAFLRYEKGEIFFLKDRFEPLNSEMLAILTQIDNSYLMGDCYQAYIDAKILELLSLQFQTVSQKSFIGKEVKNLDKIKEASFILLSDIHTPPSVKGLALQVGINEFDLRCGFKEVYNNTVYGYLFDYKMQLAEQLLKDTNKSVAEIALQCGYEYPSHFCTAFKRKFGVSPNKIRKED